jgi:nucleotide-binding universal stress UspA family protein
MKILLAYDGFERSRPALEEAARLAHENGAGVTAFSVVPPDARGSKSGGHVGMAPRAHVDVAVAHKYLREHGVESEMKIEHGEPADKIVEEARQATTTSSSRARAATGLWHGCSSGALVTRSPIQPRARC